MSFRIPLAAIALLLVSATGLAQDAVPLPDVANSKYQIDGVINVDSVYVRSGPGEGYYPTQELTKNAPVTVVGIKFDWLKILPPKAASPTSAAYSSTALATAASAKSIATTSTFAPAAPSTP